MGAAFPGSLKGEASGSNWKENGLFTLEFKDSCVDCRGEEIEPGIKNYGRASSPDEGLEKGKESLQPLREEVFNDAKRRLRPGPFWRSTVGVPQSARTQCGGASYTDS